MLRDCFDRHTRVATEPDEEEGKLKIDVVKAYFAKKEKNIPFLKPKSWPTFRRWSMTTSSC